nr:hypothetical protein [Haladaptatus cibarius]
MSEHDLPTDDEHSESQQERGDEKQTANGGKETKPEPEVDFSDPEYYLNRELSQLKFQKRVLHEALDERNPLLERVKFLSIFTTNMDEFFRKRVGGLKQQMAANVTERTPNGRTPTEQWDAILDIAREMFSQPSACYHNVIHDALADAGIHIISYTDCSPSERREPREYFQSSILPTLTPLTFDPAHPFPFISNLSLSLAVLTQENEDEESTFSRVKIPGNRPRLVQVGDGPTFVLLEDVVAANLDLFFPNTEMLEYAHSGSFDISGDAERRG